MSTSTPPAVAPLELSALLDREAIRDLVSRFGVSIDDKDKAGYANTFTEDAVLELPFGTFLGRSAIAEMKGPPPHVSTQHLFGNIVIDVDGDSATVRAYMMATHVFDPSDTTKKAHSGGWYEYQVTRVQQEWHFSAVKLVIIWQDERPMIPEMPSPPAPVAAG